MGQSTNPLSDTHVLVTRPAQQASKLCNLIEHSGGKAIRFPAIEIIETTDDPTLRSIIEQIDEFDIAIFISANAVNCGIKLVQAQQIWPKSLKVAAVGKSSVKALDSWGLIADIFPIEHFNSEALLSLEEMQNVDGKKIIIFRGGVGRELLADTLTKRGAVVKYANCYKRSMPKSNTNALLKLWEHDELDVIVTTSNEGLQNLYNMVGEEGRKWLLNSPMIVVSERAVNLAEQLGFNSKPIVSAQASDEAILNSLITWKSTQNT